MPVAVPFGQYVPGDSAVHRMDARAKLALAASYSVLLFTVGWSGLGFALVVAAATVVVSAVPWRIAIRGMRPLAWLLVFTLLLNGLRWHPQQAWLLVGPFGVDLEGVRRGAFFGLRILLLVLGTSLVTLTTSPVALTDAISSLLRPFSAVGMPVDDMAMMLSIALRFMPTTAEEAERIVVAQTARGARFDTGGPIARSKAWVPVLIPLFVNLFRRADDLAIAMESRCYRGKGRTRLREPRMTRADWAALGIGVAVLIGAAAVL